MRLVRLGALHPLGCQMQRTGRDRRMVRHPHRLPWIPYRGELREQLHAHRRIRIQRRSGVGSHFAVDAVSFTEQAVGAEAHNGLHHRMGACQAQGKHRLEKERGERLLKALRGAGIFRRQRRDYQ